MIIFINTITIIQNMCVCGSIIINNDYFVYDYFYYY